MSAFFYKNPKNFMSELRINKSDGMSDHAIQFEIDKLQKSIKMLEANIADLNVEYEKQMGELAEERNYDPWFYAGIGVCVVWFIYKLFTDRLLIIFFSFFFLGIVCTAFYLYKNFLHKGKRVIGIKEDHQAKLKKQEELLAKRREELAQYEVYIQ